MYSLKEFKEMSMYFIDELFNSRNYQEVIQWMYITFGVQDKRWIKYFGFNEDEVFATIEALKEEGEIV